MPRPPVIGIPTPQVRARWGPWDDEALVLPAGYVRAVHAAGGISLALAPGQPAGAAELLDLVDGLLLVGGTDVDPDAYDAAPHPETDAPDRDRDGFEFDLARAALARDLPLLAVCRGMQVLNVACGGTLVQHLPEQVGHEDHRRTRGSFADADHDVRLAPGSLAARVAGEETHAIKSQHHQAIDTVGDGLVVTGWAVGDDLPEAVERPANRFTLGVQWHPEEDPDSPVIAALVAAARDSRGA
ncbi:gamma-glutamyl-gamma-aminobutyrate hydrolase family protein [Svornostia abyssi]|uniref:Gamma-glutamyl-gamma-aminobutyrate hydrolase family protein n=1 Tax=Svornostia abyssi TaxID=2898438 RepID=A0ABY5PF92_9ACTN|nr:gamma-glutamyl-gamma-aminobutyrate hydrolase family protein [Parviterribacteraceae bacterium J379]